VGRLRSRLWCTGGIPGTPITACVKGGPCPRGVPLALWCRAFSPVPVVAAGRNRGASKIGRRAASVASLYAPSGP
jgi:hypothetical protein